ncbi:MAG: plasmid stabilization protein [Syntrophus sp. (in: bacteria)]|nr:plasmid stabilization protein [Syntrophus sp. (in: bacteria)]
MTYSIEFTEEAESDLAFLLRSDRKLAGRVFAKIESLAVSPREGKPLVGNHKGEFSLRLSNYRIVYELDTARQIVYILTIKHRKHVYR